MHIIEKDGKASQRLISQNSGFSIGKVNYCLKALVDIGFIKIKNFNNSNNKLNYVYILTPKGIKKKQLIRSNLLSKRNKNTINLTHISIHNFLCKKHIAIKSQRF
jgi:EPS-associated MarR family transcriptional regulator